MPKVNRRARCAVIAAALLLAPQQAAAAPTTVPELRKSTTAPLSTPTPGPTTARVPAPAMWRISDANSRIYLFGTCHMLPKGVTWSTPVYKAAMADATVTAFEVDTKSTYAKSTISALVYERGVNASYESLSDIVGADRFTKLKTFGERYGISTSSLQRMQPWLATTSLANAALRREGFDHGLGVEQIVLADAKAQDDMVAFMESAETQIKALAAFDGADMLATVDATIAQLGAVKETMEPMLAAWLKGDMATLDKLTSTDMRRLAPAGYRALVVDRNRNWTETIAHWLANKDDNYFIAVGAAHFAGPDSVIVMLQKKGLKVERIQ
jgi:uncharacterized protein YbaP (TraB family)